jgi:hypothetical protein
MSEGRPLSDVFNRGVVFQMRPDFATSLCRPSTGSTSSLSEIQFMRQDTCVIPAE